MENKTTGKKTATNFPATAPRTAYSRNALRDAISKKLSRYYGITPKEATQEQMYKAILLSVKDLLTQKRTEFKKNVTTQEGKKIYYLCVEFLIGRSLRNNLRNLGIADKVKEIVGDYGFDLDELYECEADAALGNGGLGRLAACFMDSLTTLD